MRSRRAQASTEYMMVAVFVIMTVAGVVYFLYPYVSSPDKKTADAQVQLMANQILDTSSKLFFLGPPSRTTLQVRFPPNLRNLTILGGELLFAYDTDQGVQERAFPSRVPLALNVNRLGRGNRDLVFQAKDDAISICAIESDFCDCDGICDRPQENHTHCSSDCCAHIENPGVSNACRGCDSVGTESYTPYSCNVIDDSAKWVCDGHNGCDCAALGTCT